jgi:hypothetical protein
LFTANNLLASHRKKGLIMHTSETLGDGVARDSKRLIVAAKIWYLSHFCDYPPAGQSLGGCVKKAVSK